MYDKEGRILLQKRKDLPKEKSLPEKFRRDYGMFGGGIEEGETVEQALTREMSEELELDIKQLKNLRLLRKVRFQIPELDRERELNVFIAEMPNLKELKCHEGSMELVKIKDAIKLRISNKDRETIELLYKEIRKGVGG